MEGTSNYSSVKRREKERKRKGEGERKGEGGRERKNISSDFFFVNLDAGLDV